MEIEEENKLIAEFMGGEFEIKKCKSGFGNNVKKWKEEFVNFDDSYPFSYYWHPVYHIETRNLKFHESWEWLMPVVEKIDDMGYAVDICSGYCQIFDRDISEMMRDRLFPNREENNIEATYKTVVEFIQWYNKQEE